MFSNSAAKNMPNLFEIVRRGGRKCVYKVDRHRPIKNRLIFLLFYSIMLEFLNSNKTQVFNNHFE